MIAVIMAAGLGTRFGDLTDNYPKGFLEVAGKPMIIRSIENLISEGIERIVIGTGYKHELYDSLKNTYPQIETSYSPRYAQTNSMFTLYNTKQTIGTNDFLLLESDLIYERKAIRELINCNKPDIMLATPVTKFQDQYYIEYNNEGNLVNCSTDKNTLNPMGEMVGIHKITNRFYSLMWNDYHLKAENLPKLGYEYELLHIATTALPLHVLKSVGLNWYEIDDVNDLEYAETHIAQFC